MFASALASFWFWLHDNAFRIAWWATLLCIIFAARVANAFLKDNPRIFTVVALLACTWALLLGYYGAILDGSQVSKLQDLVSDIASVLLVYAGGLLILDSAPVRGASRHVVPIQIFALYLLLFIATPRAIEIISSPNTPIPLIAITPQRAKDIVSAVLTVISFYAIGLGVWRVASGRLLGIFLLSLAIYGASVSYVTTKCLWATCQRDPPMTAEWALMFAGIKVIVNLLFCWILAIYGMPPAMRAAGPCYWILHFFGFAPGPKDWKPHERSDMRKPS